MLPWKLPRKLPWQLFLRPPLLPLELVSLPGGCIAHVEASTCSVIRFPVRWELPSER